MCMERLGKLVKVVKPYPAWKVTGRKRVGPFSDTPIPEDGEWITAGFEAKEKMSPLGRLRPWVVGFHVFRTRKGAEAYMDSCRRDSWFPLAVRKVEVRGLCRPGQVLIELRPEAIPYYHDAAMVEQIRFVEES